MTGRVMSDIQIDHDRTVRHNASRSEVVLRLSGQRITTVDRHGKFLIMPLDGGYTMIAHLGMSGRFAIAEASEAKPAHTHFVACIDDGAEVRFVDPRTFGFVAVYDEDELGSSGVARLGPDAWVDPPSPADLAFALAGRVAPIKALLLDQRLLAGLGNIYADEALHDAGIHPSSPAGILSDEELEKLLVSIRVVLARAVDAGGTTLGDSAYLLPDGRAGENLAGLWVYGRQDLPCRACGTPVEKIIIRARSTHFCPNCQTHG